MWTSTKTIFVLSVILLSICKCRAEKCAMLPSAKDNFHVRFETDRNGNIKSFKKIEVIAYYDKIVENDCVDDLVLSMNQSDGTWENVEVKKTRKKDRKSKEKFFLWKISPIVPCRTNIFKLHSGENFIEAELPPASLEDLEEKEYTPGKPNNIIYAGNQLQWEAVECATSYRVEILNDENGQEVKQETVKESFINLDDLEFCEMFEYIIFPCIGSFESVEEERNDYFTKNPNIEKLNNLEVNVEVFKDIAVVSWETSKDISCVDKYTVEVCESGKDDTECQIVTVYDPVEEYNFNVSVPGLKQATAYDVTIVAIYRGNEYYKGIKTKFETQLDLDLFHVQAIADFETVKIVWDDVAIANEYIVYKQYEDEDWDIVAHVTDDVTFVSEEEPCIDIKYAVTVVTSEKTYEKKESNEVKLELDQSQSFVPANQSVFPYAFGARLAWTHLTCIHAYQINICDDQMADCITNTTLAIDILESDEVIYEIEDLVPCKTYSVEIVPQIGENSWQGDPLVLNFTTELFLTPPPEESVLVEQWTPDTPVSISWDLTDCADSWDIFVEDRNNSENYFYKEVDAGDTLVLDTPDVTSCTEYEFQIAAVGGGNQSEDATFGQFTIGPHKDNLDEIEPEIVVGIISVEITIPLSSATNCIDQFEIDICSLEGDCPVDEILDTEDFQLYFSSEALAPATNYTVTITPIYEGRELQTAEEAFTKDISTGNLEDIEPEIVVGIVSVEITIPLSSATNFIEEFRVVICSLEGECPVNEIVETEDAQLYFTSDALAPATDYTVTLTALYKGKQLQAAEEAFTKDISTQMNVEGVNLEANLDLVQLNIVYLEWQEVYGADEYLIYQQYNADEEKRLMLTTEHLSGELEQTECSTATYTLSATRHGHAETVSTAHVTSIMNDTEPYMASPIVETEEGVTSVTWDHLGACIARYAVMFNDEEVSIEHEAADGDSQVTVITDKLEKCKVYKLQIIPIFTNGDHWAAAPEVQQEIKISDQHNCQVQKVPRNALKPESKKLKTSSNTASRAINPVMISILTLVILRCV